MIGRLLHTFWLLLVGLLLLFAILLSVARLWVPVLGEYRKAAEHSLGELLDLPVSIARMDATWRGMNPVIKLRGVSIAGREPGKSLLEIGEVWVGIDIQAYLDEREFRPASIDIIGADVTLIRDPDGRLHLDGVDSGSGGGAGLSRLLSMERLAIHNSRVTFTDRQRQRAPVSFSGVKLTLHNDGSQYSLIGYAMLPPELVYRVDLQAVLQGSGDCIGGWNGRLYLKGQSVALSPEILPWLPHDTQLAGVADVRGWVDIKLGRLQSVIGEFDVNELQVGAGDGGDSMDVDRLSGQIGWHLRESGWQLAAQNLIIEQDDVVRKETVFSATQDGAGEESLITADIRRLNLQDLRLAALLAPGVDPQYRQQLAALRPEGVIEEMVLHIRGDAGARTLAGFDAVFRDVGIRTPERSPVVQRLRGSITGTPQAGALWLDSRHVSVQDDALFRDVLTFDDLQGEAAWNNRQGLLIINSENLRVANDDLELQARLTVALPGTGGSPIVDLDADFVRGKLRRIRHYLPARIMPASGVSWLDSSLVSGDIAQGSIVLKGRLDQLPYDKGEGQLRISLPVRNAILDYSPDWTQIVKLDADVNFTGRRMDIYSSSGFIRSAKLARVHAQILDLEHPDLTIRGRVNGQLDVMLAEMDSSPVGDVYGAFVERVAGKGPTGLDLDIVVPLYGASTRELAVAGNIHLKGNSLDIRDDDSIRLDNIRGRLAFTPDDFSGSALEARLLDTPVTVDVWTDGKVGTTNIRFRGPVDMIGQFTQQQSALADVINGRSQWEVLLSIGRLERRYQVPDVELRLSSTLEGITVNLPAPLGKRKEQIRPLTATITRLAHPDRLIQLGYADLVQGVMAVEFKQQIADLERGLLVLGKAQAVLPEEKVLAITGKLSRFSLTEWLPVLAGMPGGGGPPVKVDMGIDELEVMRHVLRDVGLQVEMAGLVQEITLTGKSARGNIALSRTSQGIEKVVANLEKLILVSLPGTGTDADAMTIGAGDFPELHISIGKLKINDVKLGNTMLDTIRKPNSMEVKQLAVASEMLELRATGHWRGKRGFDRSWFDVEITNGRLDRLLDAFDYAEEVDGGELSGAINAGWQGAPWDFEPGRAEGKLYLNIRDGQLESVKPGAGRVFGLVSLHTLPRRLSLDFSDLFKKGFGFDRIEGNFILDGGNAYTDDLQIEGPAARIDITGRIGLADQDYDQLVTVVPNVSSSLPLAGVLAGGPAVGAALLLAEQLLNDEIDEMAVRRYAVTGPWSEPVYEKLDARKKPPASSDTVEDIE
jgi:uncharacterized protein (TIGR02099 family)